MLGSSSEFTRKLNRETFDALKIPKFVIKKGGSHGARHGKSEAKREYQQAKPCLRKAHQNLFGSSFQRFQQGETCRTEQMSAGWDEEFCKRLDKHGTRNPFIHRHLGRRGEGTKSIGNCACILKDQPDHCQTIPRQYEEFVKSNGELKKLVTRPTGQVRQRPEQPFQKF